MTRPGRDEIAAAIRSVSQGFHSSTLPGDLLRGTSGLIVNPEAAADAVLALLDRAHTDAAETMCACGHTIASHQRRCVGCAGPPCAFTTTETAADHGPLRFDEEEVADDYVPLCRCGNALPCPAASGYRAPEAAPTEAADVISDGFGNEWAKCHQGDGCGLEVVRPGKVQCWCDTVDDLDAAPPAPSSQTADAAEGALLNALVKAVWNTEQEHDVAMATAPEGGWHFDYEQILRRNLAAALSAASTSSPVSNHTEAVRPGSILYEFRFGHRCEDHPEVEWPHEGCHAAGIPAPDPAAPASHPGGTRG